VKFVLVLFLVFIVSLSHAQDKELKAIMIYYADGQYEKAAKKCHSFLKKRKILADAEMASSLYFCSSMALYQMSLDRMNCSDDNFDCELLADSSVSQLVRYSAYNLETHIHYYEDHYDRLLSYYTDMINPYSPNNAEEVRVYGLVKANVNKLVGIDDGNIHAQLPRLTLKIINVDTAGIHLTMDSLWITLKKFDFKAWRYELGPDSYKGNGRIFVSSFVWLCEELEQIHMSEQAIALSNHMATQLAGYREFDDYVDRRNKKKD